MIKIIIFGHFSLVVICVCALEWEIIYPVFFSRLCLTTVIASTYYTNAPVEGRFKEHPSTGAYGVLIERVETVPIEVTYSTNRQGLF